ncbi:MAG: hypothetical protein ABOK23_05880 [Candidatus Methanoperedens sp.]|nr:hypothetical protein [Candidatus Methanoperedens sp.]
MLLVKETILHDCGDWRRTVREKRFCKHIGAPICSRSSNIPLDPNSSRAH